MDKSYDWNPDKNRTLQDTRGVSFDDVIDSLKNNLGVDDAPHPNKEKYPSQRMMTVIIRDYCYLVPYIENQDSRFLKTIIPSRKATKKYLLKIKDKL